MLIKRLSATLVALTLGLGAALAVPLSASAHTGTLAVSSDCQDDGTRLVTYTGTTTAVPTDASARVATVRVGEILPAGSIVTPASQQVEGNTQFTFSQIVPGTASSAQATAFITWGDGVKSDPIGIVTFPSNCVPPDKEEAEAAASTNADATCLVPATVKFTLKNAKWVDNETDLTDGSRDAKAEDGFVFTGGSKTKTVTYTVPSRLDPNSPECKPVITPTSVPVETVNCESTSVIIVTTTTTPSYALAPDGFTWVRGADVVTSATTTREKTDAETQQCAPPATPPTPPTEPPTTPPTVVTPPAPPAAAPPVVAAPVVAAPVARVNPPRVQAPAEEEESEPRVSAPTLTADADTDSPTVLASTGLGDSTPGFLIVALLGVLGGAALLAPRWITELRRRKAAE